MESEKKIFSIAFEGPHRSGKGTQIEVLKNKLREAGIPCIAIKGEGYRYGSGLTAEDPESTFWQNLSKQLKNGEAWKEWNEASYRLARELVVWRDRILARGVDNSEAPFGVLLVDRSLISKANLKSLELVPPPEKIFSHEELYPSDQQSHKKITVDMVLPDVIIELFAPQETLLSRLDVNDPEYNFRKHNIENRYMQYLEAREHLSEDIRKRIVRIDSSGDPEEVYQKILEEVRARIPEFTELK